LSSRVSPLAVRRALGVLQRNPSPLSQLPASVAANRDIDSATRIAFQAAVERATGLLDPTRVAIEAGFETIADMLDVQTPTRRIDTAYTTTDSGCQSAGWLLGGSSCA
jgi:hypothetical protein